MTASRATQTQVWLVIAAALLSGGSPRRLDAQASPLDAGANPSTDQADPRIAQLHALREGKLAPEVEPSTLFDLSLTDQAAIEVEAARLRLLLSATERAQRPEPPDAAGPARTLWDSRLALDRARLEFFATGAFKVVRGWLSEFDLARRAHAYLFKRELERLDDSSNEAVREPLADSVIDALDPEAPYSSWISCSNDDLLDELVACAARRDGGLRALVAARGMGKTSLVRALEARVPGALIVRCESATRPMDVLRMAAAAGHPPAILLDDAHALAKPVIGGFALFDEMIALCREHCQQTLWLWTLDSALWPLLKRARDARPLFDKTHLLSPWDETQIGALLRDRCQRADIMPVYDDLIDKLPPGSDELDRQDALHAKQVGYERMLWDHVRGNPALALEAWRASLACDRLGVVHVRPLQGPDSSSLETLPDPALFVLRAVLQLAPAAVDEVALATRQSPDQIRNVLRFGKPLGMFTEQDGRAAEIIREACLTSPYVFLDQPVPVLVKQVILQDYVAVQLKARPYVFDCKYEKDFETDVHLRVLEAFRHKAIAPPAVLLRNV